MVEQTDADDAPSFVAQRRPAADEATLDILREERAREETRRGPAPPAPEKLPEEWDDDEDDAPATDGSAAPVDERARLAAAASVARARDDDVQDDDEEDDDDVKETAGMRDAIVSALRAARTVDLDDHPSDAKRAPDPVIRPASPAGASAGAGPDRFGNSPEAVTRRDLLPDIEKINSSLRPDEMEAMESAPDPEPDEDRKGGGFRFGFLAACFVILLPVLVYLLAEPIKTNIPQTAQAISAYQLWVDARRVDLEAGVESLTERLTAPQS